MASGGDGDGGVRNTDLVVVGLVAAAAAAAVLVDRALQLETARFCSATSHLPTHCNPRCAAVDVCSLPFSTLFLPKVIALELWQWNELPPMQIDELPPPPAAWFW